MGDAPSASHQQQSSTEPPAEAPSRNSNPSAAPAILAEPNSDQELRAPEAKKNEQEPVPEIAPHPPSEPLQNGGVYASPATLRPPRQQPAGAEQVTGEQTADYNLKRDSGVGSINSGSEKNPDHDPGTPQTPLEMALALACTVTGDGERSGAVADSIKISEAPPTPKTRRSGRPTATDARSIVARSIASSISPEDEVLSFRVRSLYDSGVAGIMTDSESRLSADTPRRRISSIVEERSWARKSFPGAVGGKDSARLSRLGGSVEELRIPNRNPVGVPGEEDTKVELAGGIEDWEDLEGKDVDRYGFINHTYINSSASHPQDPKVAPKRVATALFLQSQEPRKRPLTLKTLRLSPSAPEMLKSPHAERTIAMRDKENIRSRKWRDMAVMRKKPGEGAQSGKGGGVEWNFATKDSKLISRTWKGIPDCWRGAAWHAFLTASAKARGIGKTDLVLVNTYHDLIEKPSSDDVQIDLDVPRTISSHIMFRRRYKGGQRLLFRVLHSLSLYFPDVGYVQGMASIAATLLCYYDEETTFIMLIRLWELRGLERLYKPGFGGLMSALDEFEGTWMKGNQISKKLTSLGVGPTAYGTRWYLTMFNYSIPFAAQLRVWDVFMLLGDPDVHSKSSSEFGGTLDVLHAISSAILDGMRGIILKSDFEDAMKNLTSFIPVKDEDMLMQVAKREWKTRRRKFTLHHL